MALNVSPEAGALGKGLAAEVASVRFQPGVHRAVHGQSLKITKQFITKNESFPSIHLF